MLNVIRLLACLLIVSGQIDCARADTGWSKPQSIASKALDESRSYRVSVPPGYGDTPDRRYPLLVLLDAQWYGDMVASNARFLAKAGNIPDHIIVAVDSTNRLRDFTPTDSPHWEGDGGADRFLAFLSSELLPAVEQNYRTERPHIIWGHSLSGLFVLYTLYAAPDKFDARLVNDGTLDWDGKVAERSLSDYLRNQTPPKQFLYFNSSYLLAIEDPELRYFETLAGQLKEHAPTNLRWIYEPMPQESHASIPLLGSIKAMRALYDGYQLPESVMLEGLDVVLKHYETIKGRVGAPGETPESVLNEFGYLMLGQNLPEAIRAFELATKRYPASANAWDSLSDGYLEAKRLNDALKATEKSIEIAGRDGSIDLNYLKEKRTQILEKL